MATFINSFPKSGTNLLHKALELLGYGYARLGIAGYLIRGRHPLARQFVRNNLLDVRKVNVGLYADAQIGAAWLRYRLKRLGEASFITGHTPYSVDLSALLERYRVRPLIVIRDPRDVLISHARYHVAKGKESVLNAMLSGQLERDLLCVLQGGRFGDVVIRSFAEAYDVFLPWVERFPANIVRFEELVGVPGGGTANAQERAVKNICRCLGRDATESDFRMIRERLFGGTHTFAVGQAQAWRTNEAFLRIEDQFNRSMKPVLVRLGYAHEGLATLAAIKRG